MAIKNIKIFWYAALLALAVSFPVYATDISDISSDVVEIADPMTDEPESEDVSETDEPESEDVPESDEIESTEVFESTDESSADETSEVLETSDSLDTVDDPVSESSARAGLAADDPVTGSSGSGRSSSVSYLASDDLEDYEDSLTDVSGIQAALDDCVNLLLVCLVFQCIQIGVLCCLIFSQFWRWNR